MSSIDQIVIVGAGMAGAQAATSLRAAGFDGSIALLGEDPEAPYSRPPLSKGYLRGERERDALLVHPASFYVDQRIDLRPGTAVTSVDPGTGAVVLATGERLRADRIVLATGAAPRSLLVPGAQLPGVLTLRTLADADALREQAAHARHVVIVGAGWIGSEVAASLRALGHEVTLIVSGSAPLASAVGHEIGSVFAGLHRERGVRLHLGSSVTRIVGRQHVEGVELSSGDRIPADLVVVSVGVVARTELARSAGLAVGDGIQVSAELESSAPGIFAIGDVASAWHPFYGRRIRTEHISNARQQGAAVGPLVLGAGRPYQAIPSFYSEQHGLALTSTGYAASSDRFVVRGSLAGRAFIGFRLVGGTVVAGVSVGIPDTGKAIERLIRSRVVIDPARLADEQTSLEDLVSGAPLTAVSEGAAA